jgi:response regulator RpfG family c-di-GMP phosphodiesterase
VLPVDRHFLVAAADGKVRNAIAEVLRKRGCTVTLAENGSQAERVVQSVTVQTAIVESHLPDMTGNELSHRLRHLRPDCRVAVLTSFNLVRNTPELLRFGASDYLIRADRVLDLLLGDDVAESHGGNWDSPATQAMVRIIDVLVGLLELEHHQFGSTSHVATELARATADELDLDEGTMYEVVLGTLLRDIGKTGVEADPARDEVFTDDERDQFAEEHVSASLRLLEHIDFPWKVLPVVRHHHERYNGTGAPDGLRGREIPMAARIVAVVDAYVALTTRKDDDSVNPDDALQTLAAQTGHHFDPEVVEAFHRVIDKRLPGRRSKRKPFVVVVESDAKFRRLLKVRLGNVGLKVKEARNYEKCKEQLLKEPPDLALIGIDGDPKEAFQLLNELQQDDSLCRIPVAFLSARADRVLKIRALRQGVDDFLFKSDHMDELVARVENILIRGAIRAEGDARRSRRGITGSLENLSLPDIVQTLTIGMKTACVTLTSDDRTGRIWFENGVPRHADCAGLSGEDAFYEMVRWKAGEFMIEHGSTSRHTSIEHDAMFLLMEGLRLIDEGGQADRVAS